MENQLTLRFRKSGPKNRATWFKGDRVQDSRPAGGRAVPFDRTLGEVWTKEISGSWFLWC